MVTPKAMLLMANLCKLKSTAPEVLAKTGSKIHSKIYGRSNAHYSSGSGDGGWGGLSSGHYLWLCTPVFLKLNQFKNLADP